RCCLPRKVSTRRASCPCPPWPRSDRSPSPASAPACIRRAKPPSSHPSKRCGRRSPGLAMIGNIFRQGYEALRHHRRRSFLTMLGMAWGIATVVLLLAYGAGFERGLWSAFRSFGTNLIFIFPGRTSMQAGGTKAGAEVRLTMQDFEHIQNEVPLL